MEIFHNLCRCCNTEKQNFLNIYQNTASNNITPIKDMLQFCLQISITNDDKYPELICYDCVKQLEIAYEFIKRFRMAQLEFKEAYKHIQDISVDDTQTDIDKVGSHTTEQNDKCLAESDQLQKHMEIFDNIEIATDVEPSLQAEAIGQKQDTNVSTNLPVIFVSNDNTLPEITCYICQKTFFTTKALNLHLKLSHKQKQNVR